MTKRYLPVVLAIALIATLPMDAFARGGGGGGGGGASKTSAPAKLLSATCSASFAGALVVLLHYAAS
jgi:hypothetical protein